MFRRFKNATAGSTLVEVVVAITILGLVCAPICSSLVLAARVNQRSSQVMAAQLSVSNTVEQLMAEGVTEESRDYMPASFPGVSIQTTAAADGPYYEVVVTSKTVTTVTVTTYVRATPAEGGGT